MHKYIYIYIAMAIIEHLLVCLMIDHLKYDFNVLRNIYIKNAFARDTTVERICGQQLTPYVMYATVAIDKSSIKFKHGFRVILNNVGSVCDLDAAMPRNSFIRTLSLFNLSARNYLDSC
jgi:hypothetical protein